MAHKVSPDAISFCAIMQSIKLLNKLKEYDQDSIERKIQQDVLLIYSKVLYSA